MRVGVFHPGTQHSWQTALAFQEGSSLAWYATSAFYDPDRWPYRIEKFLPGGLRNRVHREFTRRYSPALDPKLVRQFGAWEWLETGARRMRAEGMANWMNRRGNVSFGADVIELIRRENVDAVWGYNTSSLEVFRWAKRHGIKCVLDQTIGHCAAMNKVMLAEQARHPEFFQAGYEPFSAEDIARQDEEVNLADLVVVGSEFCARTMTDHGCPPGKLKIVPYGYDESLFPKAHPIRPPLAGRPVNFLFVGLVCPRKGIAALLQAFAEISPKVASLTIAGGLDVPEEVFRKYRDRVTYLGSVPRHEIVKHFLAADCLIFPSLFEGSALVLHEAAAAGLAIVQSAASGDGVRDGGSGMILTMIDKDKILSALEYILYNPSIIADWQNASWQIHEQRSWAQHRQKVRGLIDP